MAWGNRLRLSLVRGCRWNLILESLFISNLNFFNTFSCFGFSVDDCRDQSKKNSHWSFGDYIFIFYILSAFLIFLSTTFYPFSMAVLFWNSSINCIFYSSRHQTPLNFYHEFLEKCSRDSCRISSRYSFRNCLIF